MKILIIDKEEGFGVGGVEIFNQRLEDYLVKKGCDIHRVRFTNKREKRTGTTAVPYHVAEKRSYIILPSEKTAAIIKKCLRRFLPDIVHFSLGTSPFDFTLPKLCEDLGIPVVGLWHGDINSGNSLSSLLLKSIFLAYLPVCQGLDGLVVFSEKMKKFYSRRGIDPDKITIIPNSVDPRFYSPGKPALLQKQDYKTAVLFLGRLTRVKNPQILLETFLKINPADTTLIMAGTGDLERELRDNYQDKRIIFTGLVSDEKRKRDIIRGCRIFVLPSWYEGMSLSLLEAMSCGLSCIATDAGANGELLGEAGILLSARGVRQELPVALKILLNNRSLQKELGQKARSRILRYYDQNKNLSEYIRLYQKIIGSYKKSEKKNWWEKIKKIYSR